MWGGRSHQLFSPVVGSEPVERRVQLNDVGAEQDKIPNLGMKEALGAANKWKIKWKKRRKKVDYQKLFFGHKVGTEQGTSQQARADDQVLGLVKEGQRCLGLPL